MQKAPIDGGCEVAKRYCKIDILDLKRYTTLCVAGALFVKRAFRLWKSIKRATFRDDTYCQL